MRWIGVVVGLAVAAAAIYLLRREVRGEPSLHSDEPLAIAIDRAAAFLGKRPIHTDSYWFAKRSGRLLGGEFVEWASHLAYQDETKGYLANGVQREALSALLANADGAAFRFPPLQRPAVISLPTRERITSEELDRALSLSMRGVNSFARCDPANVDALLAEVREPGADYVVTHQLLALLLAYENRCILSTQQFESLRTDLSAEVLRGLMGDDRFTDLTAERMAVLALAGLTSWIPDAAVARAIATQNGDGSWPKILVYGEHSYVTVQPDHEAAMALFALVNVWLRTGGRSASEPPRSLAGSSALELPSFFSVLQPVASPRSCLGSQLPPLGLARFRSPS
jgi:hypothetical protein